MRRSFPPTSNAPHQRTPETFSPTNPTHPAQTIRGRARVPEVRSGPAIPARATSRRTAAPAGVQRPHARRWRCRSPRPCQTAQHSASSNPAQDRKGTSPCTGKTESAHAREFPAQFSGAESQAVPLTLKAILRRTNKHFHQVVVQTIVELPLQGPLELRAVQIARMQVEVVSVHRHRRILELDDQFDAV